MKKGLMRTVVTWLWITTLLEAFAMGMVGLAKFGAESRWIEWWEIFGYPGWTLPVVGLIEIGGGLLLLWPRTALYGVGLLAATMLGALVTVLVHPGTPMTPSGTFIHLGILTNIGVIRFWVLRPRPE